MNSDARPKKSKNEWPGKDVWPAILDFALKWYVTSDLIVYAHSGQAYILIYFTRSVLLLKVNDVGGLKIRSTDFQNLSF